MDFISLTELENTTVETVYSSLKDCLLKLGVPNEYCRGKAYDGARTFQGHVIMEISSHRCDDCSR